MSSPKTPKSQSQQPLYRKTLMALPSPQACVDAITHLHSAFKKEHKRSAAVDLLFSTTFGSGGNATNEVTLMADNVAEVSTEELDWFARAAAEYGAVKATAPAISKSR